MPAAVDAAVCSLYSTQKGYSHVYGLESATAVCSHMKVTAAGHWFRPYPLHAPTTAGDGSSQTLLEALVQADVGFAALPCVFPHLSAARPDLLDHLLELRSLPQDSLFADSDYFKLYYQAEVASWKRYPKPHCANGLAEGDGASLWVILPVECWWVHSRGCLLCCQLCCQLCCHVCCGCCTHAATMRCMPHWEQFTQQYSWSQEFLSNALIILQPPAEPRCPLLLPC
jgi:hypothetical protein